MNNAALVLSLGLALEASPPRSRPLSRHHITSDPCLIARLPSTAFIQREVEGMPPRALESQRRRASTSSLSDLPSRRDRRHSNASSAGASDDSKSPTLRRLLSLSRSAKPKNGPWKRPEPFEIFRAIERKDVTYLMEIRDREFQLLVQRTGDTTPLLHAMRIGESHRDVAIVLLGSFSRWINSLQDEDMILSKTKVILKALRTNLKLAIDFGLQSSQSDLLSSFLQTLIMSEGDHWVKASVEKVSLALRAGPDGKATHTAEAACRGFTTRELGKAEMIASVEDYVGNATVDLLVMAAWSNVLNFIPSEAIPTWYFARDDRVYKAFVERLAEHRVAIGKKVGRRLRWQLRVLEDAIAGQTTTFRNKVDVLRAELDDGEGV